MAISLAVHEEYSQQRHEEIHNVLCPQNLMKLHWNSGWKSGWRMLKVSVQKPVTVQTIPTRNGAENVVGKVNQTAVPAEDQREREEEEEREAL